MLTFHAHVYFDLSREHIAKNIRKHISDNYPTVTVGRMHLKPVGPHMQPMFQIAFDSLSYSSLLIYLQLNRQSLPVLVHPETGNDLKDHTENALWMGGKQGLNLERL